MSDQEERIARSHFTTRALEQRHKYDAWEDSISVLYDVSPTEQQVLPGFDADIKSFMISSLMLARCQTKIQSFCRSSATIARDGMDHILVQYYLAGGNDIITHHGHDRARPGDIQIIDMAQEVTTVTYGAAKGDGSVEPDEYANISLFVARDRLEDLVPNLHTFHGAFIKAGTPFNRLLLNFISSLFDNAPDMTLGEADASVQPTVELLAAALSQAPEVRARTQTRVDQALMVGIRRHIDQHLHNPALTPGSIARHMGLSRSALFRICQPFGGVMSLIRDRRLMRARRLLSQNSNAASIKTVAYSLGFTNPSSFARAYRQKFGHAPSNTFAYTAEMSHDGNRNLPGADPAIDRKYEFWMTNMVS